MLAGHTLIEAVDVSEWNVTEFVVVPLIMTDPLKFPSGVIDRVRSEVGW